MNVKNLCKRVALGVATLGLPVLAMAESGTSTSGLDASAVVGIAGELQGTLGDFVGDALPILGGIAGAFLAFWLGKAVFRWVKGWISASK